MSMSNTGHKKEEGLALTSDTSFGYIVVAVLAAALLATSGLATELRDS